MFGFCKYLHFPMLLPLQKWEEEFSPNELQDPKRTALSGCSPARNIWWGYSLWHPLYPSSWSHHFRCIWLAVLCVLKELFRQDTFGNFIFLSLFIEHLLWAYCCDGYVENRRSEKSAFWTNETIWTAESGGRGSHYEWDIGRLRN